MATLAAGHRAIQIAMSPGTHGQPASTEDGRLDRRPGGRRARRRRAVRAAVAAEPAGHGGARGAGAREGDPAPLLLRLSLERDEVALVRRDRAGILARGGRRPPGSRTSEFLHPRRPSGGCPERRALPGGELHRARGDAAPDVYRAAPGREGDVRAARALEGLPPSLRRGVPQQASGRGRRRPSSTRWRRPRRDRRSIRSPCPSSPRRPTTPVSP